jgi:hypothetical protein
MLPQKPKSEIMGWAWWLMPIIPATQRQTLGESLFKTNSGKKLETSPKSTTKLGNWRKPEIQTSGRPCRKIAEFT